MSCLVVWNFVRFEEFAIESTSSHKLEVNNWLAAEGKVSFFSPSLE
jgi:hypothetical protein